MKPTIPEVLPLIKKLYARDCVGCCLHVVLDDGNIKKHSVESCIGYAREKKHKDCEELAILLSQMSNAQRRRIYSHHPNFINPPIL